MREQSSLGVFVRTMGNFAYLKNQPSSKLVLLTRGAKLKLRFYARIGFWLRASNAGTKFPRSFRLNEVSLHS